LDAATDGEERHGGARRMHLVAAYLVVRHGVQNLAFATVIALWRSGSCEAA
jgi:hypothetical protein